MQSPWYLYLSTVYEIWLQNLIANFATMFLSLQEPLHKEGFLKSSHIYIILLQELSRNLSKEREEDLKQLQMYEGPNILGGERKLCV